MKKIFFIPLLCMSSLFSMSDEMDLDDEMDVQKEEARQNQMIEWLEKADTLRVLYGSLQHGHDNKSTIETIKNIHNDYLLQYDDYRYNCCPLVYALASGETDFTLFLLKDKKVDPKKLLYDYCALDYFVKGIKGNSFTRQQSEILTSLINSGCEINALNREGRTPLAEHFFNIVRYDGYWNKKKRLFNPAQLINNLFDHGARIFCNPCNTLRTIVDHSGNDGESSYDMFTTIAALFKVRLEQLSKFYCDRLIVFYALNKLRAKNKMDKIPKPLIHLFINTAMQHEVALCDIKESVNTRQMAKVSIMDFSNPRVETIRYKVIQKELTPHELITHSKDLSSSAKLLVPMVMPSFWNRSLRECLQEFNFAINAAHEKEEENKKNLHNMICLQQSQLSLRCVLSN